MSGSPQYEITARSTGTLGRVLCSSRNHHFIVDGPVGNGCPGEAITPVEQFLSGVAACGVELIEVIAREESVSIESATVVISTTSGRHKPPGLGVTLLETVSLDVAVSGTDQTSAEMLVEKFKGR